MTDAVAEAQVQQALQQELATLDADELRGWLEDYQSLGELWKRNVFGGRPSL